MMPLCHVQAGLTSGLCLRMAWRLAVLAYGFSLSIILKFFRGFFFSTLRLIFLLQWQYQPSLSTCTTTKVDTFKEILLLRTSITIRTQKHGPEVEDHHRRQVETLQSFSDTYFGGRSAFWISSLFRILLRSVLVILCMGRLENTNQDLHSCEN